MSDEVQGTIPGTHDEPSPETAEMAERYSSVLSQRMALQKEENQLKPTILAAMKDEDLVTIALDNGGKLNRENKGDKLVMESPKEDE